jgi:hypothetical protein
VAEADALARLAGARSRLEPLGPLIVVAVGYATLDLDEAQRGADATVENDAVRAAADDPLLGARSRIVLAASGPWIVLLEPSTEGRVAASLARYGPGPMAEYLAPVKERAGVVARAGSLGIVLSPPAEGPLGRQRLVLGDARWGPHLLLLDEDRRSAYQPPAATIG